MSVLTLNYGVTPFDVECQRAGHAEPRRVGTKQESFAKRLTSSVRAEFMVVPVVLRYLTAAEAATVRALFALGAQRPCRGDVFNVGAETVVCSATITDEARTDGATWELSMTLYEVGASAGYTPSSTTLYLTNVASGTPGMNVLGKSTAQDPFGAGTGSVTLMSGVTIPTCGLSPDVSVTCPTAYSAGAEMAWLLEPAVADGWLTGSPTVQILSGCGTGDHWAIQDCMCKIYVVRGGVDVAQWDTGYSTPKLLLSATISMVAPAIIFAGLTGDQIRVEVYGRAARHGGYNTSDLQQLTYGNGGGGFHYGRLILGGDVGTMWPP